MIFTGDMFGIFSCVIAPLLAVLVDLRFADPRSLWHPVQGVGMLLDSLEPYARKAGAKRIHGVVSLGAVLLITGGVVALLMQVPFVGSLVVLYLCWTGLALGGLLREGQKAAQAISTNVEQGREAMRMLVSRDVSRLDADGLYKALAETLAENLNDGFVAPYFWLSVGGPVGLWCYKAVSTVDSMWGYRTEQWRALGWAGARLDDVVAYVPARLSALFLVLAYPVYCRFPNAYTGRYSTFASEDAEQRDLPECEAASFRMKALYAKRRTIVRQARSMESPNAGWPMAVAAWLHSRPMGGDCVYFGEVKAKPLLGPDCADGQVVSGPYKQSAFRTDGRVASEAYEQAASATFSTNVAENESTHGQWDAQSIAMLLRHLKVTGILSALCLSGAVVLVRAIV